MANKLYPTPHLYATECELLVINIVFPGAYYLTTRTAHSLNWYRFIGRILGKAMYEGILVDVAFAGFFLAKVCMIHICI
jgi:ubiquitin-protein ligase E3 C